MVRSPSYNFNFSKKNGLFMRWGTSEADDPDFSPFGPEIADIEISSANASDLDIDSPLNLITDGGCNGVGCKKFCYKKNTSNKTVHMSLDLFKQIMDRMITRTNITLENGQTITLKPTDLVTLKDGTTIFARNLKENMEIADQKAL